jgi:hypothetical protein
MLLSDGGDEAGSIGLDGSKQGIVRSGGNGYCSVYSSSNGCNAGNKHANDSGVDYLLTCGYPANLPPAKRADAEDTPFSLAVKRALRAAPGLVLTPPELLKHIPPSAWPPVSR